MISELRPLYLLTSLALLESYLLPRSKSRESKKKEGYSGVGSQAKRLRVPFKRIQYPKRKWMILKIGL